MKLLLKSFLKKLPFLGPWLEAAEKYFAIHGTPGYYNNPIVTWDEVQRNGYNPDRVDALKDIELSKEHQWEWAQRLRQAFEGYPFLAQKTEEYRYYYNNAMFAQYDGAVLFAMLKILKPKKVLEIGSGFSSALVLDTYEKVIGEKATCIFIDPYTDRVDRLLSDKDLLDVRFIREPVQKVSLDLFRQLEEGDVLFIDSSHIVKTSSDLNYLFFEVLPELPSGVVIHIHDIFFPFEYSPEWIKRGMNYNEAYFVRAFLMNNTRYSILFWNDYATKTFNPWFKENWPFSLESMGGSLWLRKN